MEKERKSRILAVIAILIAVVSLGVGFAAFSRDLHINGTATVKATSWDVHFTNLQEVAKTGTAEETSKPTINTEDTTISNFAVTLKSPGDSIKYQFDITNVVSFDAKITNVSLGKPDCTGSGLNKEQDETNVCNHLEYKLTYENGGAEVKTDDTLNASENKTVNLTLTYKSDISAEELPQDDVTISGLDTVITYSQK